MRIEEILQNSIANVLKQLYDIDTEKDSITLQKTKKEFAGDLTLVVFPYVKSARKSPEAVANEIGEAVAVGVAIAPGRCSICGNDTLATL